ncbi:murein hydrolase activator EnvC family protein [Bacillus sp. FSL K6-3431]|uniref:murein hydrolase activator EnvC family protein n=1 Tax=Bacillus sp. FSL K6-3431 TaxID=2921500 RepID=UPI0030FBE91D
MNKHSLLSFSLAAVLGLGTIFSGAGAALGANLSDLEQEKSNIQNKRSNIGNSINEKENKIIDIVSEQSQLEVEMKRIESEIADTDSKIAEKEKQISDTKAEIERLREEIEDLKERIEARNEMLRERARTIQMNGGSVKYIDIVLGAESFGDLVDRVSAMSTLVKADREIIEEQAKDKKQLEDNQKLVEEKLASLTEMLSELETLKSDLKNQNARKAEVMKALDVEKKHVESEKMSLEEESAILASQDEAIQKAIDMERNRLAEEAARQAKEEAERQADAERKASEQAEQSSVASNTTKKQTSSSSSSAGSTSSSSNSSNSNVSKGPSVGKPPVTSGLFMKPANGYYSSGFGYRASFGGMHYGTDIAASGTVPIVAAAAGVVIRSEFSPSYGNVVYISHHLEGKTYTTVYAHMSSLSVSSGASVSKGQQLGYMGNTGQSFGQHLHFELHLGPWNGAKSNAVDPRGYIN